MSNIDSTRCHGYVMNQLNLVISVMLLFLFFFLELRVFLLLYILLKIAFQ